MLKALQNSLLSLIYPQECRVCSALVDSSDDGVACAACWSTTRLFTGSEMLCSKCGAFFGDEAAPVSVFCHKCDEHHYDHAVAGGVYEKALAASIIRLKTSPVMPIRLKVAIPPALKRNIPSIDLIIPIPLSKQRLLERGFNQAEILAAEIARSVYIPIDASSLVRKLHTPIHRIGMDQKARELTVKNAFNVVRPKLIDGRNILLVDDVFTSGATASHCAKILKKNGAGRVDVFTLARAVMS
ncbi:MAG: ComF family protein [Pyrinomonadaceae bacterium]